MAAKSKPSRGFWADFRQFFLRGLAILLPSIITLGLLIWAFGLLRDRVAEPMNARVRQVVIYAAPQLLGPERLPEWFAVTDEQLQRERLERQRATMPRVTDEQLRRAVRADNLKEYWRDRWYLQSIGFVVAVIIIYLAGILLGGIIGRRVYHTVEAFFIRLPVIKQVYPNVKQITDFLIGGGGIERTGLPGGKGIPGGKVVVVEYPRRGIWTVGLLTGGTLQAIEDLSETSCVTIFIPSSPTPFTGYTITVPRSEVHEIPLTFDEAIRFVVSGGVLVPERQQTGTDTDDTDVPNLPADGQEPPARRLASGQ